MSDQYIIALRYLGKANGDPVEAKRLFEEAAKAEFAQFARRLKPIEIVAYLEFADWDVCEAKRSYAETVLEPLWDKEDSAGLV